MGERQIHFKRITANNVLKVCALSNTLSKTHQKMVTNNAVSIEQHHCSSSSWARAIYKDDTPIGFLMVHFGSDYDDGIDCAGAFLWRLMIATPYHKNGYGKQALDFLVKHLKNQGYKQLYTSCGIGEGSPEQFYLKYGFTPTGDTYGEGEDLENELVYDFDRYNASIKFTVKEATKYSQQDKIEEWVHLFLTTVGKNTPLSEGLKLQKRYWLGPVLMDLSKLNRCCGPEEDIKYTEPLKNWESRVNGLHQAIKKGWSPPPLIVNHNNGYLEVSDGNHRLEALQREGYKKYWVILWDSDSQENLNKYKH